MLRRLLTATVTLGVLACAVTIGLEAVGLLFRVGAPDPDQRAEAFLARLEADLDPTQIPSEPVEAPQEAGPEPQPSDDTRIVAEAPAPDDKHEPAFVQDSTGQFVVALGKVEHAPLTEPLAQAEAQLAPPPPAEPAPTPAPTVAEPVPAPEPAPAAQPLAQWAAYVTTAAPPLSRPRFAGAKSTRPSVSGDGAFGCPAIAWLQSYVAPPAARASAARTTRRAQGS